MKNIIIIFLSLFLFLFIMLFFKKNEYTEISNNKMNYSNLELRIGKQFGMQYAPVYVAEKLNLLDKYLPEIKISWHKLGGGSAVTEALAGNHLDIGFMGLAPFLIARDKGLDVKIAAGISVPANSLVGLKNKKLNQFNENDKIIVPGIGSIQHILLSIAGKKYFNSYNYFDKNLVIMNNNEGYITLSSNKNTFSHFTVLPYIKKEIELGYTEIETGAQIIGDASIICVTTSNFNENKLAYASFINAINEAIVLINNKDPKAIEIISAEEKISKEEVLEYLNWGNNYYSSKIQGLNEIAYHMKNSNFIKSIPKDEDIYFENILSNVSSKKADDK